MQIIFNYAYKMEVVGMGAIKVTVSNRGYIVLPALLRKEMEITPGTKMLIRREENKLILETVASFTDKLSGLTGQAIGETPKDVEDYIDREREDR